MKLSKKGFTLVELLVVLVILAVLAAAIIPSMLGYIDHTKRSMAEVNAMQGYRTGQTVIYAVMTSPKEEYKTLFETTTRTPVTFRPADKDFPLTVDGIKNPAKGYTIYFSKADGTPGIPPTMEDPITFVVWSDGEYYALYDVAKKTCVGKRFPK